MKALFLVNERTGKKRSFDVSDVIRRSCLWQHEVQACGEKDELPSIVARAEAEGFDVIVAVGGDGTVHETAKHLIGRNLALGILPTGSGNGFARHIGLPLDAALAIDACRAGRVVTIDTAEVNGMPFLGVMGVGFDALIADRFASSDVRGLETYVREGVFAFTHFKADDYELEANGETLSRRAFVVAVANSGQYGNNARIAPLASLTDGLLDVVVVEETTIIGATLLLARLFNGTLDKASSVTTLRTSEVRIKRGGEGPAHLDGEPVTLPAELVVKVRPLSLRLLVPDATDHL